MMRIGPQATTDVLIFCKNHLEAFTFVCLFVLVFMRVHLIATQSVESLAISPWLIDDSFIFQTVARNLAEGRGYSFDGVHPTTGVPPAWTLIVGLNYVFFSDANAVKAAMLQSLLLGLLCSVCVFKLGAMWFDRKIAWLAAIFSVAGASFFFNSMNGMETSLFAFMGLVFVTCYLTGMAGREKGWGWYLGLGLIQGAIAAIRFDGLFLGAAMVVVEWGHRRWRCLVPPELGKFIAFGCGTMVFLLPLLFWNLSVGGSPLPANQSGRRYLEWWPLLNAMHHGWARVAMYYTLAVGRRFLLMGSLLAVTVGAFFPLALSALNIDRSGKSYRYESFVWTYALLFLGALIFYQWYFPNVHGLRYLYLPGLLLLPPMFRMLEQVFRVVKWGVVRLGCVAILLLALSFMHYGSMVANTPWSVRSLRIWPRHPSHAVDGWWTFERWIGDNIGAETVIAAKDHGRLAWYTRLPVFDLAGILRPSVVVAMKNGTLSDAMRSARVRYVVMPEEGGWPVHQQIRRSFTLELVEQAGVQQPTQYRLYRIVE